MEHEELVREMEESEKRLKERLFIGDVLLGDGRPPEGIMERLMRENSELRNRQQKCLSGEHEAVMKELPNNPNEAREIGVFLGFGRVLYCRHCRCLYVSKE